MDVAPSSSALTDLPSEELEERKEMIRDQEEPEEANVTMTVDESEKGEDHTIGIS